MPSFLERSKHERSQLPLTMTSATTLAASVSEAVERGGRSVNWPLWYILPIAPYQRRKTIMKEIIPDKVSIPGRSIHSDVASTDLADYRESSMMEVSHGS